MERSHGTDHWEFCQLLTHEDDVDLEEKLGERRNLHNYRHLHDALAGRAPREALVERPGSKAFFLPDQAASITLESWIEKGRHPSNLTTSTGAGFSK
jgi:hypothetical protein